MLFLYRAYFFDFAPGPSQDMAGPVVHTSKKTQWKEWDGAGGLGDGEQALLLAVAGTISVGEKGQQRREELRFLEGLDVREVHVMARAAEAPRRRIVRARRQFHRGVGASGGAGIQALGSCEPNKIHQFFIKLVYNIVN
jgi:hypothetical protein